MREKAGSLRAKLLSGMRRWFCDDNSGMGVIEIILIIVVLISLVLIFKNQLTSLVKTIFNNISSSALNI